MKTKYISQTARKWKRFVAAHKLSILVSTGLVLLWGVSGVLYWMKANDALAAKEAAQQSENSIMDKRIQDLTEKRLADEKALQEQQAKEAKEAEEAEVAKKAAEESAKVSQRASDPSRQPSGSSGCRVSMAHSNAASIDVLVNKKHCLQPLEFVPPDLVTTYGATISAKAAADFNRMYADAAAAGQGFSVSSSYRSYSNQVSTYNYWVSINGQQGADTVSARPGFSEHQTGLAIDVGANGCNLDCFGGTSQYQWFQANAANYGFIQRYYKGFESITGYASEEWHYRYVGVAIAHDMKARGVKTLEQYWGMEGGNYR